MSYLFAGLGNIGEEYDLTRHNIGFMVLDHLANQWGVTFQLSKHAYVAEGKVKGKRFVLIKPTTYMNLSGKAINYWLQQEKISPANLLVVTDDLALPFGKMRLKGKGSSGGHNGLSHIQETLHTEHYARLRFGIGSEYAKGRQVEYVLGKFQPTEMQTMPELLEKASQCMLSFALEGLDRAMNKFN